MSEPQHQAESASYVRPGWVGDALRYSDGREDPEWSQCPSCLCYHHASSIACNGKREPFPTRCEAVLGHVRCDRPGNHLGPHQSESDALTVQWTARFSGGSASDA